MKTKEENIKTIINLAYESCKTKAEESGVMLSADILNGLSPIEMDGVYMQRALINVINNAIEASGKGQDVVISAATEKNNLIIKIKDNGSGMDKETIDNIFTPFYSKKSRGTGLGMSIAKKIVEGHRGKIWIDSKVGLGTEVMIEVPLTV
jgi:signal transduction histidine kinase